MATFWHVGANIIEVRNIIKEGEKMKHHSKKIVISFLLLLASNIAFSDEVIDKNVGSYVSLNFGAAIPTAQDINFYPISSELETGFSFGAAAGYAFSNNFRVEGELAYQLNNSSTSYLAQSIDTNIHTLAGLINGYYDFKNSSDFTPYIGAGIGVGGIINEFANDLGAAFAYQVGAGVDYSITDKIILGVKYRYTGLDSVELRDSNAASHNIYAGARLFF